LGANPGKPPQGEGRRLETNHLPKLDIETPLMKTQNSPIDISKQTAAVDYGRLFTERQTGNQRKKAGRFNMKTRKKYLNVQGGLNACIGVSACRLSGGIRGGEETTGWQGRRDAD